MENPFELILNKLSAIENRLERIEVQLSAKKGKIDEKEIEEYNWEAAEKTVNLMDIDELCWAYDLKKSFVYSKTRNKELSHYKWDGRLVFNTFEVELWLEDINPKYKGWVQRKLPKKGRYETDLEIDEEAIEREILEKVFHVKF